MRPPPLAAGIAAGLAVALLLAPFTSAALERLAAARLAHARAVQARAAPAIRMPPLVAAGLATRDPAALTARIRERAKEGGVLVEEAAALPGAGTLFTVRVRLSGPEKAVVALADSLERDSPMVRLRSWRLAALPDGGVRLTGDAVAVSP